MGFRSGLPDGTRSTSQLDKTGLWSTTRDGNAPVLAVQALVGNSPDLQPLSPSVARLTSLLCAGTWDLDEVIRIIGYDPVLSAQLLRVANSALSGSMSVIGNVHTATVRLGSARVLALAMGTCVRVPFARAGKAIGLDEGVLWRHSVASSLAAERIGSYLSEPVPPEAQTAALLHDLGHLVLGVSLPADLLTILANDVRDGWCGSRRAEHDHLGTDHASVGGSLAGHWGLHPMLVDAIAYHHTPQYLAKPHHARLAYVVNAADMVAATIGAGLGERERDPIDEASALDWLGLTGDDYTRLCGDVFDDLEDVLAWYE
jgi:HD-like signal output (HDOD) protein